jgi:hypothetical protein
VTDRELLEMAAKAAGLRVGFEPNRVECGRYDLYWSHVYHQLCWHSKTAGSECPEPVCWNPLTDDGDALRLAVRLSQIMGFWRLLRAWLRAMKIEVGDPADPYAATRRAIVRVAVEIGRRRNDP